MYLLAYYMTNEKELALGFYSALTKFKHTWVDTQKCNHGI